MHFVQIQGVIRFLLGKICLHIQSRVLLEAAKYNLIALVDAMQLPESCNMIPQAPVSYVICPA